MSYDLSARRLAWITIKWPGVDIGAGDALADTIEYAIEAQAEIHGRDQLSPILEDDAIDEIGKFKKLFVDWRGVKDGGRSVPYGDEAIARMLQVPRFAEHATMAYIEAFQGQGEIREKNSDRSLETGRPDVPTKLNGRAKRSSRGTPSYSA